MPSADSTISSNSMIDAVPREHVPDEQSAASADDRRPLMSPGFLALLAVQFLTVLNDHTFRWLVVPIAKPWMGKDNDAAALSLGLALFILPTLLLAMPAGFLADRFCKAKVIS